MFHTQQHSELKREKISISNTYVFGWLHVTITSKSKINVFLKVFRTDRGEENSLKNWFYVIVQPLVHTFLEHCAGPNLVRGSNSTSNKIFAKNFANEAS